MSDNLNKVLNEIFDKAIEAGQDIVLLRQFDNEPDYYQRYRGRVINSAQLLELINNEKIEARIDEVKRLTKPAYVEYRDGRLYNLYMEQDRIATLKKGGN